MRIDDLKTWLLLPTNFNTAITARTSALIPLSEFVDAEIILREYVEPSTSKILFLDPQIDEVEPGTNHVNWITEKIDAYAIVTRGATEYVQRDQANKYISALLDALKNHPDYMGYESREGYNGVEGKIDTKSERVSLIFKYEE